MESARGRRLAEEILGQVEELKRACSTVDEELASRVPKEGWSPRQILSHLCGPEDGGHLRIFRTIVERDTPRIDLGVGNPFFTGDRARMGFGELAARCETNYRQLAGFAAELTEEQLARKAHVPEIKDSPLGEYPTLEGMIHGLCEFHVQDHLNQLRETLAALSRG
jgi:hypothetical protein